MDDIDNATLRKTLYEALGEKDAGVEPENKSDPLDPCNSFSWSILFVIVMLLSIILWIGTVVQAIVSRGGKFSGLDRLLLFLFLGTLLQFGPMFASSLHVGHNQYSYSQSSCKLMFYTEYGTRSLIAIVVLGIAGYAWMGLQRGFESLDGKMRDNMGWLVVLAAALQGLFGIAPAVYLDYSWIYDACVFAIGVSSRGDQVAMELGLRTIVPYIIPSLILIYPIFKLNQNINSVEEPNRKAIVKIALIICITYIAMNSLYALVLIVEYSLVSRQSQYDWQTLCNFKWVFYLLHQGWFMVTPIVVLTVDPALRNKELMDKLIPSWRAKLIRQSPSNP